MFFDKKKYFIKIKGGKGSINTEKMRGMVVHLIVKPQDDSTVWDMVILDMEGDELLEIKDHKGRLDDKSGLPIGKDDQERLTIKIFNSSKNEPFKVIFKTKELG